MEVRLNEKGKSGDVIAGSSSRVFSLCVILFEKAKPNELTNFGANFGEITFEL